MDSDILALATDIHYNIIRKFLTPRTERRRSKLLYGENEETSDKRIRMASEFSTDVLDDKARIPLQFQKGGKIPNYKSEPE